MIKFISIDNSNITPLNYISDNMSRFALPGEKINNLTSETGGTDKDAIIFFKLQKTIWAKGVFYTCTPAISLKLENYSISGVTGSVEANDTILQAILKLQVLVSAADTNQKIKVGNTTFGNDDVINLVSGNNVTITPDTTVEGAPKITISATDTTYESKSAANEGTDLSLVTTGEKYTWNNKLDALTNPVTCPGNDALTADKIVLGSGNNTVKPSAFGITTTTVGSSSDNTTVPTSKAVWDAISELPKAMIFRGTLGTSGTISSLPTAAAGVEGDVYKVITANTYNSISALVGDIFICGKIGDNYQWILIPKDTDTDTWRGIKVDGTEFLGSAITSGNVNFAAGSNVTLETNSTNKTITIKATDTTYTGSNGVTLDGTGFKADLLSYTKNDSNIGGKLYAVQLDKSGKLAVNVPWTDTTYTVNNGAFKIYAGSTEVGGTSANATGDTSVTFVGLGGISVQKASGTGSTTVNISLDWEELN